MNEIKVLIGYDLNTLLSDSEQIKRKLEEACQKAQVEVSQSMGKTLLIKPIILDLESSILKDSDLQKIILNSNICVFVLDSFSDDFHGIGYTIQLKKICIVFSKCHSDFIDNIKYKENLSFFQYNNIEILYERITFEIYRKIISNINHHGDFGNIHESKYVHEFWGLDNENFIYLICPEIPETERIRYANPLVKDHLKLAKFADIDSLVHLKSFLSREFPKIKIFEHTYNDMPIEANNENLIIIGGIAWNSLTEIITQQINLPFIQIDGGPGNPDPIINSRNDSKYEPEFTKSGFVQKDIGYFVRVPNPMNIRKKLYIINGVLTHGVLGVARCFTDDNLGKDNCKYIIDKCGSNPYFAILLNIPVVNNYAVAPALKNRIIQIDITYYSKETNDFT